MSGRIEAPGAATAPQVERPPSTRTTETADAKSGHAQAQGTKRTRDLEVAAREFEQIFVRSMLKGTPMAGKGDVYGDLAVDAMAKSVTAGRGLGLGDLIRHAVEKSENALKDRE